MDSTGTVAQVTKRPSLTLVERLVLALLAGFGLTLAAIVIVDPFVPQLRPSLPGGFISIVRFVTHFGEGYETLVPAGLALLGTLALLASGRSGHLDSWLRQVAWLAGFVVVSVGGLGLLASALKNLLGRARPKLAALADVLHIEPLRFHADYASLPSGHATTAGATAMVLALLFPRYRPAFAVFAIAVAVSRVLLAQHYVSDVIMGLTLGAVGTLGIALLFARGGHVFVRQGDTITLLPAWRSLWANRPDWRRILSRR